MPGCHDWPPSSEPVRLARGGPTPRPGAPAVDGLGTRGEREAEAIPPGVVDRGRAPEIARSWGGSFGKPIGEPIAWYGPIVMNTQEELRVAFDELERGTFIEARGR
jgi:pirin-like protein